MGTHDVPPPRAATRDIGAVAAELWSLARAVYERERVLTLLGVLGIGLGLLLLVAILVRGADIPPEGDLMKPASFNLALGIYLVTIAAMAPFAGFSKRGRQVWRASAVPLFLYAYGLETIQQLRGLDPRFTEHGSDVDLLLGGVFFLVALGVMGHFLVLAWHFTRRSTAGPEGLAALSVRYAALSAMLAFGAGIFMSVVGGRVVPEAGSMMPLHALGFHALQAVPVVALLLLWSSTPAATARRRLHVAGLAWFGLCVAAAWQTLAGRPVLEQSVATGLAAALLLAWGAALLLSGVEWWRDGARLPAPMGP